MAEIYTGEKAKVWIGGENWRTFAIADFTLTISRDTIDQPLLGEIGPYRLAGPTTVEGSFTVAKFPNTPILTSLQAGTLVEISGTTGEDFLDGKGVSFYFKSGLITRFDLSMADASTITTASIDFIVIDAYNLGTSTCWISGATL